MNAVIALAQKELRLLVRDKFALFWIFAFPLMFALFFGALFSSEGGGGRGALSLALVDEDGSANALALVERLVANESLVVHRERPAAGEGAAPEPLTLEAARDDVRKGRRVAYLRIPAGYGANPYALFGGADEDAPGLEIGIDPRRQAEAGFLQGILMEAVFGALQDRFTDGELLRGDLAAAREQVAASADLDFAQKALLQTLLGAVDAFVADFDMELLAGGAEGEGGGMGQPFEVVDVTRERENEPRSAFDITFPQALVWGLMSVAMTFAITLVRERTAGTLLRLRMAPISRAQLLAGKAVGCFLGCLMTMAVLLTFAALALGVRFDSLPLLALAMVCTALCFTGLMMTVSVLGKTENAVAGSSWGLMMPFAMVGGGMIPLIAMPEWLRDISSVSPFKWAILAVEGAAWRGFSAGEMALPCSVLLGIGLAFFALGVAVFRRIEG